MANSDAGKLEEKIYSFEFRNFGAITIPKLVREIGYIQSLDIIIESIDYNEYRSSKTAPSESLFGYATLVFQDCFQNEKFPLRFGRNRIYSARNEQALSQWEFQRQYYSLQVLGESLIEEIKKQIEFSQASSDAKDLEDLAAKAVENPAAAAAALATKAAQKSIVDAANLAYQTNAAALPLDPPQPQFIELPLREFYILGFSNCQFRVEFTQIQPVSYLSDRGRNNKGESRQSDGKKDRGVPKGGTAPRKNPPNSPFGNNTPPTGKPDQGDFYNDKNGDSVLPQGELDRSTGEGTLPPFDPNIIYWIEIKTTYKRPSHPGGCGVAIFITNYFQVTDASVRVVKSEKDTALSRKEPSDDACGNIVSFWEATLTGGDSPAFSAFCEPGPPQYSYGSGLVLPSRTSYYA